MRAVFFGAATLLLVAGSGLMGYSVALWPQAPQAFVVTLKDRCLTDEGNWFTIGYSGSGTVKFTIKPPEVGPAAPERK